MTATAATPDTRIYRSSLPAPAFESLPAVVLRHARAEPETVAVVDGATGQSLTRRELAARSSALATGLRARGIGEGDLVALAMPNLAWWPAIALGVWRAGAALAALSPLWTVDEAARVLAGAPPRLAIAFGPLAPLVRGALESAGVGAEVVAAGGEHREPTPIEALLGSAAADPFAEPVLSRDDPALVPFSSGTGGLPKGVRLTHGNLAAGSAQAVAGLSAAGDLGADSVLLAGAAFFHSMGFALALGAPLVVGARIITIPRPELEPLLQLVDAHRVTHLPGPPPIAEALARDAQIDAYDLSSLRMVAAGGAHVPAGIQREASARLGCLVRQGYGMTEATCTISCPIGGPSTPETAGSLVPGVEARLVDPATARDVAEGEPGELWIRGPNVMQGYHGLPEETARTITEDGWLRTGDLVAITADGELEIRDRLKELVKVNGASVAPAELELVLREHPAVRDAGVVGLPDPETGEAPVAFVVLAERVEPEELAAFAAARLAEYKHPREVIVVDEVPRSPLGKVLRRELRDVALAGRASRTSGGSG